MSQKDQDRDQDKKETWKRPLGDPTPKKPLRESVPIGVPKV